MEYLTSYFNIEHIQDTEQYIINLTKTIRNLAKLNRIKLDETLHISGLNLHLFDYIKYCKGNLLDYLKEYLSNLQPFMLESYSEQKYGKNIICVLDNLYRISVYIKIDKTQFSELIVSFHENNKKGIAKTNIVSKLSTFSNVYVFADIVSSHIDNTDNYGIKIFMTRGMLTLPLNLMGKKCGEVYEVMYGEIETAFLRYCNDYLRNLYTSNLNLDFDTISIFETLQQLTFTSYGKDTFSTISLLIDSSYIQKSLDGKKLADTVIMIFINNLKITQSEKSNLEYLIKERFRVYDKANIGPLETRVIDILNNLNLVN